MEGDRLRPFSGPSEAVTGSYECSRSATLSGLSTGTLPGVLKILRKTRSESAMQSLNHRLASVEPRKLLQPGPNITLTREPDCITWDDAPVFRARMPCGHVFDDSSWIHTSGSKIPDSGLSILRRRATGSAPELSKEHTKTQQTEKRLLKPSVDLGIKLTEEPCCICWDDDPATFRAKMPCGHVFSPEAMNDFVKTTLEKRGFIFRCPALIAGSNKPCEYLWDYKLVRHVACFTAEEQHSVEKKMGEHYLICVAKAQQCPNCKQYCVNEDKQQRVGCFCGWEFCWACLHKWETSDNNTYCGNDECEGEDPRLRYLKQHPEKKLMEYSGLESYAVRACPGCGFIIHHTGGCKLMVCDNCGLDFCFVCLKLFDQQTGEWPCGGYDDLCNAAPLQTELPEAKEE